MSQGGGYDLGPQGLIQRVSGLRHTVESLPRSLSLPVSPLPRPLSACGVCAQRPRRPRGSGRRSSSRRSWRSGGPSPCRARRTTTSRTGPLSGRRAEVRPRGPAPAVLPAVQWGLGCLHPRSGGLRCCAGLCALHGRRHGGPPPPMGGRLLGSGTPPPIYSTLSLLLWGGESRKKARRRPPPAPPRCPPFSPPPPPPKTEAQVKQQCARQFRLQHQNLLVGVFSGNRRGQGTWGREQEQGGGGGGGGNRGNWVAGTGGRPARQGQQQFFGPTRWTRQRHAACWGL